MTFEVQLRPVTPSEHDPFFEEFTVYHAELDGYDSDPAARDAHSVAAYRAAILEDLGHDSGRELLWIEVDGARAGFAVVHTLPDWPDDSTDIAEIAEFYIESTFRRRGVGRAAVEAILADHRARGTRLIEAAILRDNAEARAFWAALGFEVRSVVTAREP